MLFTQTLQKEINTWIDKKYISHEQALNILQHYNLDLKEKRKSYSIISILGYFFLGLSIIVLIGHNWENIPIFIRAFGLIFLTLLIQGISFYRFKKNEDSNLFFLGNLLYGASIILIAQAYHLGTYMPDGIFWWTLGVFLIALFTNNKWINLQAFILAIIWYIMEVENFYPWFFWLFLAMTLFLLYKDSQNDTLFTLFVTSFSLFYSYTLAKFLYHNALFHNENFINLQSSFNENIFYIDNIAFAFLLFPLIVYGIFLLSLLFFNTKYKNYMKKTRTMSIVVLYVASFFLLIKQTLIDLIAIMHLHEHFSLYSLLIITMLPIFIATFFLKKKLFFITTFILTLFLIALFYITPNSLLIFFVLINASLFILYGYLIYQGVIHNSFIRYFLGVLGLLSFAMIRYFSLIEDYISTSLLFFVCSIVLLGASFAFKKFHKVTV